MTQADLRSNIMPHPIIAAQQLSQTIRLPHQNLTILKDINLQILPGEQVAITGRSGSGKSTLLGILAALDRPSSGELSICGEAVHQLNEEQRARLRLKYIGFVFQSFQLLPALSALENVMLPLRLQPDFNYSAAEHRALQLLARVGLKRQARQSPKVLSGGEQQRVAIARALVSEPAIIFADEPTGNLDSQTAQEIEQLLFELNRELGTTLIVVTHDADLAQQCQRRFELLGGELLEQS